LRDADPFDWYQRFYQIRDHIVSAILPENRVLNVGAGNSRLSEEMFDEGYETITNIDISQTVTKAMTEKYKEKGPNFKYVQMDVRAMDFTETFDAVIDKGTLDCILVSLCSYLVWRGIHDKCQQDDIGDLQGSIC
jgi:2-polyprenyl-3-methyl-5-hydroxy-6-metoxy-1,4-benzoquinol methylase